MAVRAVGIFHSKPQHENHISYGLHSETAGLIQPPGLVKIRYVALNVRLGNAADLPLTEVRY